jgi:DNA-binding transcriptional regulator YdaS (Cro superfamily)
MTLDNYLKVNNLNYGQFAKQIGVSRNAVYFWATGRRRPNTTNTLKIEAGTGHLVTARDLFNAVSERETLELLEIPKFMDRRNSNA